MAVHEGESHGPVFKRRAFSFVRQVSWGRLLCSRGQSPHHRI